MPLYLWRDKNTGYEIEVLRPKSEDYLVCPQDSELPADERGKDRDWQKLISSGITTTYAQGRGKGNWGSI